MKLSVNVMPQQVTFNLTFFTLYSVSCLEYKTACVLCEIFYLISGFKLIYNGPLEPLCEI